MNFPKSNPDLTNFPNKRYSKKMGKPLRNENQLKDFDYQVVNPFRNGEQTYLPPNLRTQLQQLQYISSKSIKKIEMQDCRRTSSLQKNLIMMQEVAKKQQQKFLGMLKEGPNTYKKKQEQVSGLMFGEEDKISIQLNGFCDQRDRINDDFNIFGEEEALKEDSALIRYYSNEDFQLNYGMDEEFNNYLN